MLAIKTISRNTVITRRSMRLLGDQFEISIVGDNPIWAEERIDDAIAEINRVEKLLSAFSEDSIINHINRNAGVQAVSVNSEIFKLVERAAQISELTYGVFDVTYVTASEDDDALIADAAVKPAVRKINYKSIELNTKAQTIFLKEKNMRIGFGAISKGYAADRAKYVLQMQGVSNGVINAGGDLLTWGAQPGHEPWTVAVADPSQRLQPFANIDISNMAFSTSVNAEKYVAINTRKLPGAVSQRKGFPVSKIKSVSIMSTTAEFADAMATPVFSLGINASLYLINQLNQMACVAIDDHDRIYTSQNIAIS